MEPIDNTKAFITGSPVWGTVLGIAQRNNIVMGAVNHPMLAERLIAVNGATYYRGRELEFKRLRPQSQSEKPLAHCVIATSSLNTMAAFERAQFSKLAQAVRHVIYYYDCYAYTLLAKGYIDAVLECHFKPYDFLGLVPVLKGAGCCVCNWQGSEVCYASKVLVSRNRSVQANVLELINDVGQPCTR